MDNTKANLIADHYHSVIQNSEEYKDNKAVACNNPELLLPDFRSVVYDLTCKCASAGINIKAAETFRTNALQLQYYRTGASKIKIDGMHHFGIAQDLKCFDDNGNFITRGDAEPYIKMRQIAVNLGLNLLGLWDAGHLQYVSVNEQNSLRQIIANYVPGAVMVLKYGMENHYVMTLKVCLQNLGYSVNTDTAFFGDATDEALRTFQITNGLVVDGICGKATYEMFKNNFGLDLTK